MDVISSMATMAMAIPTITFGHRYGHFWPQIWPQMDKLCLDLNNVSPMGVISGMATMAMAIPTISFGHRSGHFWPQIRPQMAKISQIYAQLVIWPYLQYPYDYGPVNNIILWPIFVHEPRMKDLKDESDETSQNNCKKPPKEFTNIHSLILCVPL